MYMPKFQVVRSRWRPLSLSGNEAIAAALAMRRRSSHRAALATATAIAASLGGVSDGHAVDSSVTSIAEKQCQKANVLKVNGSDYAVSRICPGRDGYKVFIDEEDLRETLTIGKTIRQAAKEPAAQDRFGAFNGYDDTIEWRSDKADRPFALIVGCSFADNENLDPSGRPKSMRLLVVMRLPPGPVCKVAYIERAANSNANELARQAADQVARGFKCGADPVQIVGQHRPGIEAMLRLNGHKMAP
jgi:hypothetical protein